MLKIHKPYKTVLVTTSLFVSGALLLGYSCGVLGFGEETKTYAADDFSTEYRTISDIRYMQEMNQQICSNTTTPVANSPVSAYPTATLVDKRDNEQYNIVKLEDGNCWMQQNLRLKGGRTLTPSDSDVENDWEMPETLIGSGNTVSGWMNSDSVPYSAYFGNTINGVYYNWRAAVAMDDSSSTTGITTVNTSICPKNWKLPTGNTKGEFNNLMVHSEIYTFNSTTDAELRKQGGVKVRSLPYNFQCAGYVDLYNKTLSDESGSGLWWSRTVNHSQAYRLRTHPDLVLPVDANNKGLGSSVRCVAAGGLEPNEGSPILPSSKDGNVVVNVTPTITLDVSDGVTTTAEADKISTGEIKATVTSNASYDVLLSAEEPRLVGQHNLSNYIPVVSVSNPVQPGNNAWGIVNASGLYDPVTTVPTVFYNTTRTVENSVEHTFGVGISINSALPADTYATEVTVTAATK